MCFSRGLDKFDKATLCVLTGCNVEHEAGWLVELEQLAAASKVRQYRVEGKTNRAMAVAQARNEKIGKCL